MLLNGDQIRSLLSTVHALPSVPCGVFGSVRANHANSAAAGLRGSQQFTVFQSSQQQDSPSSKKVTLIIQKMSPSVDGVLQM